MKRTASPARAFRVGIEVTKSAGSSVSASSREYTLTLRKSKSSRPAASRTRRVTTWMPGVVKTCSASFPSAVLPSGNSQRRETIGESAGIEPEASKRTVWSTRATACAPATARGPSPYSLRHASTIHG